MTRVTHSNLGRFAVSPDGSKLIYQSFRCPDQTDGDLMLRDLATGTERRLAFARPSLGGIAWGPDNWQVAMLLTAPDPGELWLLDTTTGQARQVRMAPPQILQPIALKWPPGFGQIVIALYSNPGGSNTQARVLYVDPATGVQTSVVLGKGRDAGLCCLDVDASGQYLIYVLRSRSGTMTIWWDGDGKPVRRSGHTTRQTAGRPTNLGAGHGNPQRGPSRPRRHWSEASSSLAAVLVLVPRQQPVAASLSTAPES